MADPNNLLIHEHKLCLMLICKAGNTSIKWAIAKALGVPETHRTDLYYPKPNKADAKRYRKRGYLVLSVVRHPVSRLVSCWRDKVSNPKGFHKPFARKYGNRFKPGMSFDQWAAFVADIPDGIADQHFRSMTWDLVVDDEVVPQVIKIESPEWWAQLRGRIADHCGLDIGEERKENKGRGPAVDNVPMDLIRERYAQDFQRFCYDA